MKKSEMFRSVFTMFMLCILSLESLYAPELKLRAIGVICLMAFGIFHGPMKTIEDTRRRLQDNVND